ncbi:hypothetical protein AQ490_27390 [Wenjunlia vitaminophila]|uniref:DUF4235 domain-containing protein n=1 Tax=Wenjunlia vitaminophila TaxID=76728 RepID=A0A0T6LPT1_WENVI|nr:DUF4235 domain-containing protein [Wenjunlia vitaminophila]KRV48048.1 hypothetical protein AQ490_27390 [Wenjunlia vitaminophila]
MQASKVLYKPVGVGLGALGGALAGVAFNQVWKWVGSEEQAPEPTDERSAWREVLLAAALHGAIFAVVRAAVQRGGATGVRRLTGVWPAT